MTAIARVLSSGLNGASVSRKESRDSHRLVGGVILFMCTIVTVLALSAGAAAAVNQPTLRLFDVTVAHGIVDNEPDRPASLFTPDDSPIYVWYRAEGCGIGTAITSVWWYITADSPIRISEGTVIVEVVDDWGQFNFALAPGKRWAIGDYRVDLRVGDATAATVTFRIAEDASPGRSRAPASSATRPRRALIPGFPPQILSQDQEPAAISFRVPVVDKAAIVHVWRRDAFGVGRS